jgi:pyruvate dehydrogenase E2 component (dihydrolipoamide acetyltransferase)
MTEQLLEKVTLPETSEETDESLIVFWYKSEGDPVKQGEELVEIQTEKASFEVEAPASGVLKTIYFQRGQSAKVGDVLAVISPEDHKTAKEEPSHENERTSENPDSDTFVPASPRVRHLAKQLGVNLSHVTGTGPKGRLTEDDIRSAEKDTGPNDSSHTIEVSGVRKTVARRMTDSLNHSAQLTETTWADVTSLSEKRQELCPESGWNDWVMYAVAQTLLEHPMLNATWKETEIEAHSHVNLGIATDTENGLYVPVIKEAEKLTLTELQDAATTIVNKAKENRASNEELSGSTFTVSNLGAYGIQFFTPIINPPEAAILGIGRIESQVVLEGDQIKNRERLPLSLTFDHRIVDGAPAARFLQSLVQRLESPETLI